tara:strand:- start:3119 stop:4378 length:1260 start_codon:yes stop_codon:yes gene_type:complete
MYALVDCNNFYASCERVFNPSLRDKPIAILSNNDGCVISRSDEAKALGLPMGAPAFKYKSFFELYKVQVFSSNYPLYGDMSRRVMKILERFTPDVEIYSIDEAFLRLEGFENYDLESYANTIRECILKWTGIPTCVGIAPTKALSKVANKIARKFPEITAGIYVIDTEEKRLKALKWTPIDKVWGIGIALSARLRQKGCKTAYDFIQFSDAWLRQKFSINEWRLKKDLEGISKIEMEKVKSKRMIATTRSFEENLMHLDDLKERISTFASICAEKLRRQDSSCYMLLVFLRSNRFINQGIKYRVSKTVAFPFPTDSSLVISSSAISAIESIYKQGVFYKKAGVILMGIVPTYNRQLEMFDHEDPRHKPLMSTIDFLNKKYGNTKLKLGSQDLSRTWKMRQQRLSPRYTTNLNDIISVKC